jgi:hypothetical protein
MRSVRSEEELTFQLAQYMRLKHPTVLYHFDFGAGTHLSMGQAAKQKRLNSRAWPDLFIAKSTMFDGTTNPCAGLFLELKRDGTRLKKRDGSWANEHTAEQAAVLDQLRDEGYYAEFAVGYEEAVSYIERYLNPGRHDYHGAEVTSEDEVPF